MNTELHIYVPILVTRKKKQVYVSSRFPVHSSTLNYVYSLTDVPGPQEHFAYLSSFLYFIINIIQVLEIGLYTIQTIICILHLIGMDEKRFPIGNTLNSYEHEKRLPLFEIDFLCPLSCANYVVSCIFH